MKIKELIKHLKTLDQDLDVYYEYEYSLDDEYSCSCFEIRDISQINIYNNCIILNGFRINEKKIGKFEKNIYKE